MGAGPIFCQCGTKAHLDDPVAEAAASVNGIPADDSVIQKSKNSVSEEYGLLRYLGFNHDTIMDHSTTELLLAFS